MNLLCVLFGHRKAERASTGRFAVEEYCPRCGARTGYR